MRKRREKAKQRIDSSAWTGDPPPRHRPKEPSSKPLAKWQIVATAVLFTFITLFAWVQLYSLLTTGTISVRRTGFASLGERPVGFVISCAFWLGWAGLSAWFGLRLATSAAARKRLAKAARRAWRDAP